MLLDLTRLKRKRITVERLPHLILDQLLAHSRGTLSDDVAVLAIQFTAKPRSSETSESTEARVPEKLHR